MKTAEIAPKFFWVSLLMTSNVRKTTPSFREKTLNIFFQSSFYEFSGYSRKTFQNISNPFRYTVRECQCCREWVRQFGDSVWKVIGVCNVAFAPQLLKEQESSVRQNCDWLEEGTIFSLPEEIPESQCVKFFWTLVSIWNTALVSRIRLSILPSSCYIILVVLPSISAGKCVMYLSLFLNACVLRDKCSQYLLFAYLGLLQLILSCLPL